MKITNLRFTGLMLLICALISLVTRVIGYPIIQFLYKHPEHILSKKLFKSASEFPVEFYQQRLLYIGYVCIIVVIILLISVLLFRFVRKKARPALAAMFILYCFAILTIFWLSSEIILQIAYYNHHWHDANTQFDATLGWKQIPNQNQVFSWGTLRSNSFGWRGSELNPNTPQLIILGDSVAWGFGLDDKDTLAWQLESLSIKNKIQALTLAVSGYGIDQSYLTLKKNLPYINKPQAIIMVICSDNDLSDTRANFAYGKRKPLFILKNGSLCLTGVPIQKYCLRNILSMSRILEVASEKHFRLKMFLKYLSGDFEFSFEEGTTISSKLLKEIAQEGIQRKIPTVFVLIPSTKDFSAKNQNMVWFEKFFSENKDLHLINGFDVLKKSSAPLKTLYFDTYHLSTLGTHIIAEGIDAELKKLIQ